MKHKRTPINKKKRAEQLAARVKETLGLSACTPLLTQEQAEEAGYELPGHVVKFRCVFERDGKSIETAVPIRRDLLGEHYKEDEAYLVGLISRVWMDYLQSIMARAVIETGVMA